MFEEDQKEYAATTGYISLTNEFMQGIGAKLGYDYVFSYQAGGQMMFGNPNLDITDEIISELNNAYKNHGEQ
jgi:Skp family chaperone for outer membrane proteins